MPRRNLGTLLENVVLTETVRLLTEKQPSGTVEFINSFVMPPLANWGKKENDNSLSPRVLETMSYQLKYTSAYAKLMRLIYDTEAAKGPSGALLAAMSLKQSGLQGRFWLNDLAEDNDNLRYKGETDGLAAVETVASRILKSENENGQTSVCHLPFPSSLDNLDAVLKEWSSLTAPIARIGYLDPDDYSIPQRNPEKAQTDPASVSRFLELLQTQYSGQIASVHFLYGRTPPKRRDLIDSLVAVGEQYGFGLVHFISGNFLTVVHHRETAQGFSDALIVGVQQTLDEWVQFDRNRRDSYTVHSGRGGVPA